MSKRTSEPCKQEVGVREQSRSITGEIARSRKLTAISTVVLTAMLVVTALAANKGLGDIFRPFLDDSGKVESVPSDQSLDEHNAFFDPAVGTNGQACVTCHQPAQGITIHTDKIDQAFVATSGLDPLFRPNDTADRPDADTSTLDARANAYKLFLDIGVVRIGKTFKGNSDPDSPTTQSNFRVEPQNTAQFGPLPNVSDPQHPGIKTLSVFRRPLVNTNVNFDSALLWDGRDSISTVATSQVPKAIQSLLTPSNPGNCAGCPGTDPTTNQAIANFMLGVYTDQVFDNGAGNTSADGAASGVYNLLAMSQDPARPCTYAVAFPQIPSGSTPTRTPFSPSSCTQVDDNNSHTFGSDMFDAWANLSSDEGRNANRASIARGQEIFNTAVLHQPPDLDGKLLDVGSTANGGVNSDHADRIPAGAPIHCVTCHATRNLGNNPNPNFIGRIGTDSIDILANLVATRSAEDPLVQGVLDNVKKLPLYCLRPNSDATPFTTAACGTHPGDVRTTDPGRAMVTGLIADAGKFKPPILRGLAARSPYFHAGTASDIFHLIDFYDARFQINLTQDQKNDLANFLEAF